MGPVIFFGGLKPPDVDFCQRIDSRLWRNKPPSREN